MNTKEYTDWLNTQLFDQPSEAIKKVHEEVSGFSAPHLMAILSQAVSYLDDQEIYLEIGSNQGRTLVGAMVDNPSKQGLAVDNFSMFDGTPEKLDANLVKFEVDDRVRFYEMDSNEFFEVAMPAIAERVGVYFYDGNHNTEAGFEGLCNVVPHLAREAVIILDDFSSHGVWKSVIQFLNRFPRETSLLFCMGTNNFPFPSEMWWNGVVVISWKMDRNQATGV